MMIFLKNFRINNCQKLNLFKHAINLIFFLKNIKKLIILIFKVEKYYKGHYDRDSNILTFCL